MDGSTTRPVTSWEAPSPTPDLDTDAVISIHHLSSTGTTCLILEGGDIITVQESMGGDAHIEIVGSIDAGIAAARWSPDEELLLLVTKANTGIFMGSSLEPIVEVNLTAEDLKASKHVSVGWGKKETQFEGRGAKALRDPTIPEKVDQGLPSMNEDNGVTISWRGDGAYVAVNSVQDGQRRVARVYSREGELDSASEPVDGLETALSWRPSGNLIAGIQRLTDRIDVVFFERNGLRHGQFTLRSSRTEVLANKQIRLEWNSDSTVLAVILDDTIQMWTMGNYHWYLKQEMPKTAGISGVLSWHPEKALRYAASSPDSIVAGELILQAARGTCFPLHDTGAVAVIDGNTAKLTPFRTANIPPPYAMFEETIETSIIDVAFAKQNTVVGVLHHGGVDLYEWPVKAGRSIKPTLLRTAVLPAMSGYFLPLRITAIDIGTFQCIAQQGDAKVHFNVSVETGCTTTANTSVIITSTAVFDDGTATEGYGQDQSGSIYKLSTAEPEILPIKFASELPWFEVTKDEHGGVMAIGLSRSGHVYADSQQLAKNCTSFVLTPDHLIFTTSNHLVKYVHLTSTYELEVPGDDPEKDERCRAVERGSRLVTAIPTKASIVLQMPRGNLETIFPRAMVLAAIRKRIDEKDYAGAFSYCRTQRVDMNLLCDYQPAQFLANVGLFLDQLNDIAYIDLFLSSLREEDVTVTMYQDTRKARVAFDAEAAPEQGSKVNRVCDAILKALQVKSSSNLQNIVTAHVCKNPPALEDGLSLVAKLQSEDAKMAEKAVEHICFLVDVNRLYETALGLYNLDLALLVAQQSQRDPREYLPFMQHLHSLSPLRRSFEIDEHLTRREKALTHLKDLGEFDELCEYTVKHALFRAALQLYRYDAPRQQTLTGLYAEHLAATSKFREAGLAYESLQNYDKAASCYLTAGSSSWQECLFAAKQTSYSPEAFNDLASNLAEALYESKQYGDAATVHDQYLSNTEEAIRCLCKGYLFADAMLLVSQRSRPELLASAVDAGIAESISSTTEFLADCKAQLGAQVPRVKELRIKAAEDPLAFYEGERPGGADVPDDVSVAASSRISTGASLFTRYTGKDGSVGTVGTGVSRATSKNRRREEKKRARGRKGTVYEEEYLVNSVRRLVDRVGETKTEVERLVVACVRRGMMERGRNVEALLEDVVTACEIAVAAVFTVARAEAQEPQDGEPQWRATGGDAVLQDWAAARSKLLEAPLVAKMEKLTLLG